MSQSLGPELAESGGAASLRVGGGGVEPSSNNANSSVSSSNFPSTSGALASNRHNPASLTQMQPLSDSSREPRTIWGALWSMWAGGTPSPTTAAPTAPNHRPPPSSQA